MRKIFENNKLDLLKNKLDTANDFNNMITPNYRNIEELVTLASLLAKTNNIEIDPEYDLSIIDNNISHKMESLDADIEQLLDVIRYIINKIN